MIRLLQITRSSLMRYSAALIGIAAALLFLWPGLAGNLFASGFGEHMFMSHGHCYLWVPSLVALHVSSDLLIGISYTAISLTLAYLVHRARRDIPFHWIFLAFGLFIVACGATHFMEVWTLWNATYWLSGYAKLITAAASVATAVVLPSVVPKTLFMVREAKQSDERKLELEKANQRLEEELARRTQADTALRETNQILATIFQSSPLAIYAVDADGKTLMWNPAAERIFGWREQETIGRPLPIVAAEEQEEFRQLRARALRGDVLTDLETRRQKKDGTKIEVSISIAPLRDATGENIGMISITADITERKRAEEKLRHSEERFRLMVESVKDYAIFMLDTEGRIITWNVGAENIKGYQADEIIGNYFSIFYTQEAIARGFPEHELKVAASEGRFEDEGWRLRKDGTRFWANVLITAIRDTEGQLIGFAKITHDLTERKGIEDALRASESELRALFAAMTDVILVLDDEGRYLKVAPTNPALLYRPPAELLGKTLHEVFSQDQADFFLKEIRQTLAARKPGNVEYSLPVNGAETWFAGTISPLSENSVIFVARDITEGKRAQETLRESEERYRELVENANDIIYTHDLDGRFTSLNRAGEMITGYAREKVSGMNLADVVAPEYMDEARRRIADKVRGATLTAYELEIIARDGHRVALEVNSRPIYQQGVAVGIQGIARDVTDRKRAEEARRESELRFRSLVQSSNDAIILTDQSNKIILWNKGAQTIFGYGEEKALGQELTFLMPQRHREAHRRGMERYFATGESHIIGATIEFEGLRKDGSEFPLELSLATWEAGGETFCSGIIRDITERKRAEAALLASEGRLAGILDIAEDGIISIDKSQRIIIYNQGAEKIFGYSEAEIIGQPVETLMPGRFVEQHSQHIRDFARSWQTARKMGERMEVYGRRKDGSEFPTEISISKLELNGETVFTAMVRDITERKRAEAALRANEELFRELLELLPVGVYSCDRNGLIKHYNRRAVELWGRAPALNDTRERFCGSHKMYWPDGTLIPRDQVPMAEALRAGVQVRGVEAVFERPDHSRSTIEVHIVPLKDETGNLMGAINCFLDITERKQKTEALEESERQLATAQQIAQMGSWEVDFVTGRVRWSDEVYRIFGLRPEEYEPSYEGFIERVHPDDRDKVLEANEKSVKERRPLSLDHRIVRPDGTVRMLHTRGELVTDQSGNVIKVKGIGQDITERKRVEAERDAERRLLEALLDQLPVGVLVADIEGRYIKTNQRVCEILGIDCNALAGMKIEEVRQRVKATHPKGTPLNDAETASLAALRTQQTIISAESIITTPGGKVRRINANAAPIVVDGGAPFGSIAVITDVTEQYALQEQLRQSQKMESIGTLAGGVAHDFNNLLTVILGNTQLAFRGVQPDTPLQQRLLEIEKAGNRATTLTRQLLAFSRRQRLELKVINLNDTINDFMKMLRRIIGENIEVRVHESIPLHPVFADPAQIEQVVMNLAVNARDAMPHGGQLIIETRNVTLAEEYLREHSYAKPGRYVQMIVSDTGTGMDAETKARIFEPFFTTKEIGRGTGLGLSTVYGIVKQHDGMIEVYSEAGQGTSFKIYLPVEEKAIAEEAQEEAQPPLRGGTETILVAEDEEALRGLARSILEELGYTVLLARDGAEAVEMYEANREQIALMLFDIVMPRMGGREAYERISQLGGAAPALFMTGYSAEIVQSEFVKQNKFIEEAGAQVMQKPYSVETLGRKVREMLDAARKA